MSSRAREDASDEIWKGRRSVAEHTSEFSQKGGPQCQEERCEWGPILSTREHFRAIELATLLGETSLPYKVAS
mgnify:CR=1